MNLSFKKKLRKEKSHEAHPIPSLKKTRPEEFDLVILGGGTDSDDTFPILGPDIRERSVCPQFSPRCSAAYAVYREDQWKRRSKPTELES